jgi:hypothetical protein
MEALTTINDLIAYDPLPASSRKMIPWARSSILRTLPVLQPRFDLCIPGLPVLPGRYVAHPAAYG